MHQKLKPSILHRDLKADNCFLYGAADEEYLNVKVGDFGLATHVNNSGRKTMLGECVCVYAQKIDPLQ